MARILYLYAQPLHSGGVHARKACQMLALMKQAGLEVDLLSLPGRSAWAQDLASRRYQTMPVPFARSLPPYGRGVRRFWATCAMTAAAIRLCLKTRYDAIHCSDRGIRAAAFVAWLFRTPFIFEWGAASGHDLVAWLKHRSRHFTRLVSLIFSEVPCPMARLREVGLYGRLVSLPMLPAPSVKPAPLPAVRLRGATQPFHLVALSLNGRGTDLKSFCDALRHLPALANLHILISAGTAVFAERLRQGLIRSLPLAGTLDVRPAPHGALELLSTVEGADLVFLPAVVNGSVPPPEVVDVMAAQRALLAVRCPAYEGLLNAEIATLVPGDAEDIADAIRRHVLSPLLCTAHAEAAYEAIRRERNATSVAATLRSCYRFALTSPRS